ncbi:MAG: helix-turn-helix domain-containing protein [Alphaproteobacteria bacterium]
MEQQAISSSSPFLDTKNAAAYLGCRPGTLKTWRAQGRGPRYYIVSQKLVRYSKIFLDEFVRGENLDAPRHLASTR